MLVGLVIVRVTRTSAVSESAASLPAHGHRSGPSGCMVRGAHDTAKNVLEKSGVFWKVPLRDLR